MFVRVPVPIPPISSTSAAELGRSEERNYKGRGTEGVRRMGQDEEGGAVNAAEVGSRILQV